MRSTRCVSEGGTDKSDRFHRIVQQLRQQTASAAAAASSAAPQRLLTSLLRMPNRCQSHQQLHHNHHHRQQSLHHPLPSTSSFLSSVFLSAGCCAVIFLASAIAGAGFDPLRQLSGSEIRALAKIDQPQGDRPTSEGKAGPGNSTLPTKDERRAQQEKHFREQIKLSILNMTGMNDGPLNISNLHKPGKDAVTLPGKDQEAWMAQFNSVRPRPSKGGLIPAPQGNSRPMEITNKIKEFADEVPNLLDVDGAVQFVLHPKQTPGYNGSQRVINATMKVLVRLHRDTESPKPKARRRITIVVYLLDDEDAGRQNMVGPADPYLPIAQLTVLVRKTNWHKVLLPTTIVQRVLDSSDKVLRLRVLCLECNDETEVVMTPRRTRNKKIGRKSMRTGRPGGGRGGESRRHPVETSLLGDAAYSTNRKSLHLAPTSGGDGESKRSPVLIVSTKSSSRFRKTA